MTTAKQVPALVAAHQDYLLTEAYREFAFRFYCAAIKQRERQPKWDDQTILKYADKWRQNQHDLLNISSLFHVSESMLEVAKVAAEKLPSDSKWSLESAPSPRGVLVFEKPLYIKDVWGRTMSIASMSWAWEGEDFSVVHYCDPTDMEDEYNRALLKEGTLPMGCGPWQVSHVEGWKGELGHWYTEAAPEVQEYLRTHEFLELTWDEEGDKEILPSTIPEFANTALIAYSIFALMDQTIVSLSEETDRKLARRFKNKRRPPSMVTVIQLRRKEYHGYHQEGTGTWLTYRSVTRGHWRMQPYGKGRSEVKRIWISPYIRGGEDLPFWQPKRVSTLAR